MKQGHGHTGPRNLGEGELKWQVRINLTESFAKVARANPADPELKPLQDILTKHNAVIKHQEMSFGGFLPYFENEERPELMRQLVEAAKAIGDAAGKGIDAEIE